MFVNMFPLLFILNAMRAISDGILVTVSIRHNRRNIISAAYVQYAVTLHGEVGLK
jgi:hypothetical protein